MALFHTARRSGSSPVLNEHLRYWWLSIWPDSELHLKLIKIAPEHLNTAPDGRHWGLCSRLLPAMVDKTSVFQSIDAARGRAATVRALP